MEHEVYFAHSLSLSRFLDDGMAFTTRSHGRQEVDERPHDEND